MNLEIDQMDVVTAFLNSHLDEDIYMQLPNDNLSKGKIVKLLKSIYGLKQPSRSWNLTLDKVLKKLGLSRSHFDPCMYFKTDNEKVIFLTVYVDDLLIFSNDKKMKFQLKEELKQTFKMKDMGPASYILGMRIIRNEKEGTVSVDQEKYIKDILARFEMTECNSISTPLDPNQVLSKCMEPANEEEEDEMKRIPYQEAVGSLIYAANCCRPDIAHAVGVVSRFNQNPGRAHWKAVKRIFRYLKGTLSHKLVYKKSEYKGVTGFADSDWAGCTMDFKSTTGYIFTSCGGAVSWLSKKQPTTALSTTEAEYMSLTAAAQEAKWISNFLTEILSKKLNTIILHCDNKGAIDLSKGIGYKARTKHISIKHHFIRECIENGDVQVKQISTNEMVADPFTKAVTREKLTWCCQQIGLMIASSAP